MRLATAFAAAATLAIACSSAEPPDFEVLITSGGGDQYTLLIYDDTRTVTGARAAEWPPGTQPDAVLAFPDTREIQIGWTGGACHHRPSFEISGSSTGMRIDVFNPMDPQLPFVPVACPAIGVPLRVTLSLTEAVLQEAVEVRVVY